MFVLMLDKDKLVYDCDKNAVKYLQCSIGELFGERITRFMPSYVAMIHNEHFFHNLETTDMTQLHAIIKRLENRSMSKATCRYVMYNFKHEPFMCGIDLKIQFDDNGICGYTLYVNPSTNTCEIPIQYR